VNHTHAKMMPLIELVDKDLAERVRKSALCYQYWAWMRPIQSPRGTYYMHETQSGAVCTGTHLHNP
jgi:hypothetical protein